MTAPARFVLYDHRLRPATAGEVEEYLVALLGRHLWTQRAVIPTRLTIVGELGDDDQVIECFRDDLPRVDAEHLLLGHPEECAIGRGGFPLVLADWLLAVCDPMRDLLDDRLESAFPSLALFLLYQRLRDLAAFLRTLDPQDPHVHGLDPIAQKLRAAMAGVPPHIPFSRLNEAVQRLGYRPEHEMVDPLVQACRNAAGNGSDSLWVQPLIPFPPQGPAASWHRMAAWSVTGHTLASWNERCPW